MEQTICQCVRIHIISKKNAYTIYTSKAVTGHEKHENKNEELNTLYEVKRSL